MRLLAQEEVEGRVRRLEVVAAVLELLQALDRVHRALGRQLDAGLLGSREQGALARQLRDQQLPPVADDAGVDVLEGARVRAHAGDVHPALVGERVAPDVRLVGVGGDVAELVDEMGGRSERRELLVRHAGVAELQLERGQDRDEVRVAAALADAVHRALHERRALLDRRERVGDAALGVVVGVDPDPLAAELRDGAGRGLGDLRGQAGAVRVAQRDVLGAHRRALPARHRSA